MIHVRQPSGLTAIGAVHVRDADGLHQIATVRIRTPSGLATYFGQRKVTITPGSARGTGRSSGSIYVTTGQVTASLDGGTIASITWSTTASGWAAVAPTSATTSFRSPPLAAGDSDSAIFTASVTDTTGAVTTADIRANASNLGGFYGAPL